MLIHSLLTDLQYPLTKIPGAQMCFNKFWRYIQANWNLNFEKGNRDLAMNVIFQETNTER
jgi:hypothetical protein